MSHFVNTPSTVLQIILKINVGFKKWLFYYFKILRSILDEVPASVL
jgi:hypothetical protein